MRSFLLTLALLISSMLFAQKQTYDLLTFTPPKGWKKKTLENNIIYSTVNAANKTWAQISVIKSTASKGSIGLDLESEWNELVVKNYGVTDPPAIMDTTSVNGWNLWMATGKFVFNGDTSFIILSTFSNDIRCISLTLASNTSNYEEALMTFATSMSIKPYKKENKPGNTNTVQTNTVNTPSAAKNDGFTFTTTNFEDGWTSVVKEDWVEATKGNIKVLLHYPRAEDKNYYPQYKDHVNVFWNLLVAPRYTNLRQYESPGYNHSFPPGLYGAGLLNDNITKKDVWVVLFSRGKSGWIEVISPDKATFVRTFGVDNPDSFFDKWDPLTNLSGLNKFAVGENDLVGKWSNDFFGSTSYYNIYSGLYAGYNAFTSRVNFIFNKGKTYNWELSMAQTSNGAMKVDNAKANGSWKMLGNWQIWFSDIERSPKTYNAYFTCIKGGRVLWLQDVSYGSYEAYGKISK